ncbi:MAG TPA: PilT/PilU family type 4a pilus ATPase [Thermoanaerobaculia bacterium]
MTDHLHDPDLDRLVHELNRRDAIPESAVAAATIGGELAEAGGLEPWLDAPERGEVGEGEPLDRFLGEMARREASDLLLLAGMPAVVRVHGALVRLAGGPLSRDDLETLFARHLSARTRAELAERGATDFSLRYALAGGGRIVAEDPDAPPPAGSLRLRVNLHRQRGSLAASIRALPRDIPSLASLHLPPSFADLVRPSRGLVLLCGPTGSGKSSTLAALVAEINRTRSCHVITIEDPVEFEHRPARALVEHIEIGRDARSFAEALRAALRQDPDVLLIGEMRDLETVATALTAAETGHLVLSTLHTNDAMQAVHRIVDVFPPGQQAQIRHQLALSLHAIIVQQLVPRAGGRGRVPAVEVLLANYPVRHHIRSDNLQKLYNEITLGKSKGMISFEESLAQLVHAGTIDVDEARVRASHPEELESRLLG